MTASMTYGLTYTCGLRITLTAITFDLDKEDACLQ